MGCENFTSIDLALHSFQFKVDEGAYINISLYDLRESYDEKTLLSVFNIEFVNNIDEVQIGEALFKAYYVSIDMENKKMLYSPLNHFPAQSYGVYVIRFLIGFGVFTIATALVAMLWQNFNDPFRKNKFVQGQDGIQLVSYEQPNQFS